MPDAIPLSAPSHAGSAGHAIEDHAPRVIFYPTPMLFDVKRGVVVGEGDTVGDEEGGSPGPLTLVQGEPPSGRALVADPAWRGPRICAHAQHSCPLW